MTVAVYYPGALVGFKLRRYCDCGCHRGNLMHFAQCCIEVKDFPDFPLLDEDGTPRGKLPNCPNCGADKLGVLHQELLYCHGCGWKLVRGESVGATT